MMATITAEHTTVLAEPYLLFGSDTEGWVLSYLNPLWGQQILGDYPSLETAQEAAIDHQLQNWN
jgi:hypothetical protein